LANHYPNREPRKAMGTPIEFRLEPILTFRRRCKMFFVFKGEQDNVRHYEVAAKDLTDLNSGLPTLRHLLESATRDRKELEVRFKKAS